MVRHDKYSSLHSICSIIFSLHSQGLSYWKKQPSIDKVETSRYFPLKKYSDSLCNTNSIEHCFKSLWNLLNTIPISEKYVRIFFHPTHYLILNFQIQLDMSRSISIPIETRPRLAIVFDWIWNKKDACCLYINVTFR